MTHAVLIDFGSTYTKVAVADLTARRIVTTGRFPSTVSSDASIALEQCFALARETIGERAFASACKLASSSAAGGLRMGVVGLSRTLSAQAGRSAAFGAGAKILHTAAGKLKPKDIAEMEALPLEILLFCGGYEGGGTSVLLHNAKLLAESRLSVPILYAGNSAAGQEVRRLLTAGRKDCYLVPNLIPDVETLNKAPAEEIIREVFLRRIVNKKGLDKAAGLLDRLVMPTPAVVLSAGELLSKGTATQPGLGDLIIVDVGGATTDIHSYARPIPYEGAKPVGVPEPFSKRTVEGDLGLRESSETLCREIGMERMEEETGLPRETIGNVFARWLSDHEALPKNEAEKQVDRVLTAGAVRLSARRHCGTVERISSAGLSMVQHGKNLTGVRTVIGTGGPLLFGGGGTAALRQVLRDPRHEPGILLPEQADFYLDRDYILFAAGLLREIDEDAALTMMKNSLAHQ